MALQKEIINEKGIVTNYHKISNVGLCNNRMHCCVESFVSKDYRAADQCADTTLFSFDVTVEEEESMGIRALCYSKIKALDAWADAVDC